MLGGLEGGGWGGEGGARSKDQAAAAEVAEAASAGGSASASATRQGGQSAWQLTLTGSPASGATLAQVAAASGEGTLHSSQAGGGAMFADFPELPEEEAEKVLAALCGAAAVTSPAGVQLPMEVEETGAAASLGTIARGGRAGLAEAIEGETVANAAKRTRAGAEAQGGAGPRSPGAAVPAAPHPGLARPSRRKRTAGECLVGTGLGPEPAASQAVLGAKRRRDSGEAEGRGLEAEPPRGPPHLVPGVQSGRGSKRSNSQPLTGPGRRKARRGTGQSSVAQADLGGDMAVEARDLGGSLAPVGEVSSAHARPFGRRYLGIVGDPIDAEEDQGHRLYITGPMVWCGRCGRYAKHRLRRTLRRACAGEAGAAYATRLARLRAGLHPLSAEPLVDDAA